MNAKGCMHVQIVNGRVGNVFCHVTNLPQITEIIHLQVQDGEFFSEEEFSHSHPNDTGELSIIPTSSEGTVYDLGDASI